MCNLPAERKSVPQVRIPALSNLYNGNHTPSRLLLSVVGKAVKQSAAALHRTRRSYPY